MSEMNRRQFVNLTVSAVAVSATCAQCAFALLDEPTKPAKPTKPASTTKADMGPVGDYSKPGMYGDKIAATKVIIVSDGKELYAMSALCTHRATPVRVDGDNIACPAHGSRFSKDGKATNAPAKASLFRHPLKLENGKVIVDKSKRLGEKEWTKPGATLVIEAKTN